MANKLLQRFGLLAFLTGFFVNGPAFADFTQLQIKDAFIASQVYKKNSSGSFLIEKRLPNTKSKYPVKNIEIVILGAVIEAQTKNSDGNGSGNGDGTWGGDWHENRDGNKSENQKIYFSDFDEIEINGRKIKTQPWNSSYGGLEIKWFKIEHGKSVYSNEQNIGKRTIWKWGKIKYSATSWPGNSWTRVANVTSTFLDENDVGTMRYDLEVYYNGRPVKVIEKSHNTRRGEVNAHQVSVRGNTGNDFIDWAYSFFNLPFIWGSAGFKGPQDSKHHQSELYIGADCADFVVAAARKAGYNIPYTWSKGLFHYSDEITKQLGCRENNEGYYFHNHGEPVKFNKNNNTPNIGDLVLWTGAGRHVAILIKDKSNPWGIYNGNPNGILDSYDIVLHTNWHEPEEKRVGEAYRGRISIRRLKKLK